MTTPEGLARWIVGVMDYMGYVEGKHFLSIPSVLVEEHCPWFYVEIAGIGVGAEAQRKRRYRISVEEVL